MPLRAGVTGVAVGYAGFRGIKDYRGTPDIFGRKFKFSRTNIADGLATAAVLVMGEGNEQTPIAIIEDIPFVEFEEQNPSNQDLSQLKIPKDQDIYAPILNSVVWKKGGVH